ncbi:beta-N-acetylhexosaminidase [Apibacter raozihei]|uniref:beta-N-acetylhexosaminidase n=1 Tax=Apibacter raozihei TaxID=2500547 RepID=UPI000FE2E761|nr:beta-N-acetylhexosaminidase [Apibacter raozihei]
MRTLKISLITAFFICMSPYIVAQTNNHTSEQMIVDVMSSQLQLNYKIVDNFAASHGVDCSALGADWGSCNKALISFYNKGKDINDKNWTIYFHSIRRILKVDNPQFKISHITGDLHKLEPTNLFTGFQSNKVTDIPIIGEYWQLQETDVMPRWYVTSGQAQPKIITNTDTEDTSFYVSPITGDLWKRTPEDHNILMNPESRFEQDQTITLLSPQDLRGHILPTPVKAEIYKTNILLTDKGINLDIKGLDSESKLVLENQFKRCNIPVSTQGYKIVGNIKPKEFLNKISGAYKLEIKDNGTDIVAYDERGLFYAVQSVISLLPQETPAVLPALKIEDYPRFDYRGLMIDVGRNFKSKEAILKVLDQMSKYKMNKFHFHLTDDEGWRIEIQGLPELTEVGGKRCHDLSEQNCLLPQLGSGPFSDNAGTGFYTKSDYIDILKYAKARYIDVIPEINMPAHARAAVVSMEARYNRLKNQGKLKEAEEFRLKDPTDLSNTTSVQYYDRTGYLNLCMDSSKKFVTKIIEEMAAMHKEAGHPITTWHFGGDEAKNIKFGAGFQDINAADKVTWKGTIDQSKEDHPFEKSQVCKNFIAQGKAQNFEHLPGVFAVEVSKILKNLNIKSMQAWQDGLKHVDNSKDFATDKVYVNFWDPLYWGGSQSVNEWRNKGYQVVISNPDYVYLDMPNEVNTKEPGYYWATRSNNIQKVFSFAPENLPQNAETSVDRDGNVFEGKSVGDWKGIAGISAHIWEETIRTPEEMEYMLFPRLLAVAERAWHKSDWELDYQKGRNYKKGETHWVNTDLLKKDWIKFANYVGQKELSKLENSEILYRLPVPGAKINNKVLTANIILPSLNIEYSTDKGQTWIAYDKPVRLPDNAQNVMIRSRSKDGKRTSRSEYIN